MANWKLKLFVLGVVCLAEIGVSYTISNPADLDPEQCAEAHDIDKMIPIDDILKDIFNAYRYDPEVRATFQHISSPEFREKTDRLEKREEYAAFILFCRVYNLRIPDAFTFLKSILPSLVKQYSDNNSDVSDAKSEEIHGGVDGLIKRIFEKRIPMKDIQKCFHARLQCDPAFKGKIDHLHSLEFRTLLKDLRSTPEYKEVIQDLEQQKIYFDSYLNLILNYFDIEN